MKKAFRFDSRPLSPEMKKFISVAVSSNGIPLEDSSGAAIARKRMLQRQGIIRSDSAPEEARRRMLERMGLNQGQEGGAVAARTRMIERGKRHGQ